MTQIIPPPNNETREDTIQEEFHFIPGELEPIAPKKTFPAILKQVIRPMFFGAIGIHALLLFTPLSSPQQTKPKETAEPVKVARLSDKILVKSMPKVKVAAAPKKLNLPKIAVASTNPVIVNLPEPEKAKTEETKTEDKKTEQKKPEDTKAEGKLSDSKLADGKQSNKGVDPSTVDPRKATTDENAASKLDAESQKVSDVITALRTEMSPGEPETDPDANFLKEEDKPFFFTADNMPKAPGSYISPTNTLSDVEAKLKNKFETFIRKGSHSSSGAVYEAKIGATIRYVTIVEAGGGIMVFLWKESPI